VELFVGEKCSDKFWPRIRISNFISDRKVGWVTWREWRRIECPKNIFTQELEGTRRRGRGRPRKGWREEVERDLQVLGVRKWREMVIDREKLRGIVRQDKAHSGL
jgi:hypothetical protein